MLNSNDSTITLNKRDSLLKSILKIIEIIMQIIDTFNNKRSICLYSILR